jgi:hypothetical protein
VPSITRATIFYLKTQAGWKERYSPRGVALGNRQSVDKEARHSEPGFGKAALNQARGPYAVFLASDKCVHLQLIEMDGLGDELDGAELLPSSNVGLNPKRL